jgi:alkanesulfonate monooxygenase SsuD/methylene tetrahydromethanopterin reductase-like flavin-dependent oxidoreductase (luciferase family)
LLTTTKPSLALTAWNPQGPWRASQVCAQAALAESLGYHSFWLPENHFGGAQAIPSPLTLLAAAAGGTTQIKLATTSYLITLRHPLQAAEETAVFDQLCEGRLILGLGRGFQPDLFRAFALPAAEKRQRFEQNLALLRQAWSGKPLQNDDGSDIVLAPLPLQRPHPPIWVAAFGPKALQQVATLGLPYLASPMETLAQLSDNYRLYNQAREQAGHGSEQIVPVMRTVFVSDRKALISRLRDRLEQAGQKPGNAITDPHEWTIIGDQWEVQDRMQQYSETLNTSHMIITNRFPGIETADIEASIRTLANLFN